MSNVTAQNSVPQLHDALRDAVWRQWSELGGSAVSSNKRTRCVIDLEALILITLWLADEEPRLVDVMVSWTTLNSGFISVQRIKNLCTAYPPSVADRLPGLARVIVDVGADARWKPLYGSDDTPITYRDNKIRAVRVDLKRPPVLWLRLRGIFGLGIRPDIIAFLMRRVDPRDYVEVDIIADAVGYSRAAVKRVLDALVEADSLSMAPGRDPGYAIGWRPLFTILDPDPDHLPLWRYCHQTYTLAAEYLSTIGARGGEAMSAFLQRVEARRMIQHHGGYLIENRMFLPHEFPQLDEVEPFLQSVTKMLEGEF